MDPIARMVAAGAAGVSGSSATYVDDVFSTFLYDGTGSAQTITNGIDLSGEGGLVWAKVRNSTIHHHLVDTERGGSKYLRSSQNSAEGTDATMITGFNSDGFTIGSSVYFSQSPRPYATWTFRKAPGFFDVVTYTGTGSAQNISHSLGSVPGMMLIKRTDSTGYWYVYHRNLGNQDTIILDASDNKFGTSVFNNTTPTSSVFTVASGLSTNGGNYVAYIFAHDDQSFDANSDESIIKCGSFTTNGSGYFTEVNLGWEPQWLLIKRSDSATAGTWLLIDNMRGLGAGASNFLYPNDSGAEASNSVGFVHLTPTGFKGASQTQQQTNATYIYMAIRRPHKPPTAATEVFTVKYLANGSTNLGFVADTNISKYPAGTQEWYWNSRLTGNKDLNSNNNGAEDTAQPTYWDLPTNTVNFNSYTGYHVNYVFRRAPGFFDVVTYTGGVTNQSINHNLGVKPDFIITKARNNSTINWICYHSSLTASNFIRLNTDQDRSTSGGLAWNSTEPTSTQFTLGNAAWDGTNYNGTNYIAYLFASLDGISKVGSYTGTGSNINVDCGFTAGARFILIKRTDSSGDWYVWDTARGIVSGNDPYHFINSVAVQVTNTDYIDPLNAGFTVTSSAPAALNTNGANYIFLAIA